MNNFNNSRQQPLPQGGGMQPQRDYSVPTQHARFGTTNYLNQQVLPSTQTSQRRHSSNNAVPVPIQQQYQYQQMYQMSANNTAVTQQHNARNIIYQSASGAQVAPPVAAVNVSYNSNNGNNIPVMYSNTPRLMTNYSNSNIYHQNAPSPSLITVTNHVVSNNQVVSSSTQPGGRQSAPPTRIIPIHNQVSSNIAGSSQPSLALQHQQLQRHILGQSAAVTTPQVIIATSQPIPVVGAGSKKNNNIVTVKRDSNTGKGEPENDGEEAGEEPVVNKTEIRIDDDISIVSETAPKPLPHMRCHCPRHSFTKSNAVVSEILGENSAHCDKCFCYICDKKVVQCEKWTANDTPHCNAHPGASCWKARRNLKMETMIPKLPADLRTPELLNGEKEMEKMVIDIRQSYIDYRKGISCLPEDVPCSCQCHSSNLSFNPPCAQCRGVHDLKKKFNYHPVRVSTLNVINDVMRIFKDKPISALVAMEGIIKELCLHRPADFNHITMQPANPDLKCQCNTPEFMEEHITPKLVELCTRYDVGQAFIKMFDRELRLSSEPLQLGSIFNRYLSMRHWNNILLRAVLNGQNTSGRMNVGSRNDILRETIDVIKWRIFRLEADGKYLHVARYLKVVKIQQQTRVSNRNWLKEAMVEVERALRINLARLGRYKEVCYRFADDDKCPIANEKPEDLHKIFSLMVGQNLPSPVALLPNNSFNTPTRSRHNTADMLNATEYKIEGKDETVFIILYLITYQKNEVFSKTPKYVMWFSEWCNRQKHTLEHNHIRRWVTESTQIVNVARASSNMPNNFAKLYDSAFARDKPAVLFSACLLLLQFFHTSENHLEDMIVSFKNNEWALFYLISQTKILKCGKPRVINWFNHFFTVNHKDPALSLLTRENLKDLIKIYDQEAVFKFLKIIIKDDWATGSRTRDDVFDIMHSFCERIQTTRSPGSAEGKWIAERFFTKSLEHQCYLVDKYRPLHLFVARTLCLTHNISYLSEFDRFNQDLFHCNDAIIKVILMDHCSFMKKDLLTPLQINQLISACITQNHDEPLLLAFKTLNDQHRCYDNKEPQCIAEVINLMRRKKIKLGNKVKCGFFKLIAHEVNAWFICAKCAQKMSPHWITYLKDYHIISPKDANLLTKTIIRSFLGWIKVMKWYKDGSKEGERFEKCLQQFLEIFCEVLYECGYKAESSMKELLSCNVEDADLKVTYTVKVSNIFTKYVGRQPPPLPAFVSRPPQQSNITTTTPDPATPRIIQPNIILPTQPSVRILARPNGSTPSNHIRVETTANNVILITTKPQQQQTTVSGRQFTTATVPMIRQFSNSIITPKGRHNLPFTPSASSTGRQFAATIPTGRQPASSTTTVPAGRQFACTIPTGRQIASSTATAPAGRQLASTTPIALQRQPASPTNQVPDYLQLSGSSNIIPVRGRPRNDSRRVIPTGRQLASSITTAASGRQLASSVATAASGRQLASSITTAASGRQLASSVATAASGRQLASSTTTAASGRQLTRKITIERQPTTTAGPQLASTVPTGRPINVVKSVCGKCNSLMESCKCLKSINIPTNCPRCNILNKDSYSCKNCNLGLFELKQQLQQMEQQSTEAMTTSQIGGGTSNDGHVSSSTAKNLVTTTVTEDPVRDDLHIIMTEDLPIPSLPRKTPLKRIRKSEIVVAAATECKLAESSTSDIQKDEKRKDSEVMSMDISTSSSVSNQTRNEMEVSAEETTIISLQSPNKQFSEKNISIKENQQVTSTAPAQSPSAEKVVPSEVCCTSASSSEVKNVSRLEDKETTQEDILTIASEGEQLHNKDGINEKVDQEMEVVEAKENEIVETAENEIAETKENEIMETTENETVETTENELVEKTENETVEAQENELVETKENELVETTENETVETTENETVETKENELVEITENELVETKENELVEITENETVETTENETVETTENETVETKENELVETTENETFETKENETVETTENESVETKKNETVETTENETVETTENETVETTENETVKTTENEPVETKANELVETTENELVETTENETVETTENETVETTENETVETTENETFETKENELVEAKENEIMGTTENVETKENETVETQENEPVETQENEPVETKENELIETKESETVETKENELVETKENEFVGTTENETVETKENDVVETQQEKSDKISSPKKNFPSKAVADVPEDESKVDDATSEQNMITSEIIECKNADLDDKLNSEKTLEDNVMKVKEAESEECDPVVSAVVKDVKREGRASSKEKQEETILNTSQVKRVSICLNPSVFAKASSSLRVEGEKATRKFSDTKTFGKSVRFADEDSTSLPTKRKRLEEDKTTKVVGHKQKRVKEETTKREPIEDSKTTTKPSVNEYPVVQQKPAVRKLQAPKMSGRQAGILGKFTKSRRGAVVGRRTTKPLRANSFTKRTLQSSKRGGNEAGSSKNTANKISYNLSSTPLVETKEIKRSPDSKRAATQERNEDVESKKICFNVGNIDPSAFYGASSDTPQQLESNSVFNWNQTRKRKQGPATKTGFYVVNPAWDLTGVTHLPPNLQMPLIPILSLTMGNARVKEKLAKEREKKVPLRRKLARR